MEIKLKDKQQPVTPIRPVKTPEEIKSELPNTLENARKLLESHSVRGLLCLVFMENGDVAEASDLRLCSPYEAVGALDAVQLRLLMPKQ